MDPKIDKPVRKDLRLKGYDYASPGFYFVTVCTRDKIIWFGDVKNKKMNLNKYGRICQTCLLDLPKYYQNVKCYEYIIMPNHVHVIFQIVDKCHSQTKCHGLPEIIRGFKSFSSKEINNKMPFNETFFWQRSFFDEILKKKESVYRIRKYIKNNPKDWIEDKYYTY